jgi:hypothetical protein
MGEPEALTGQSYPEPVAGAYERTEGDDVEVRVRVRRVNLPALEAGVELGIDLLTHRPIVMQLVARDDGTHDLMVVTNPIAKAAAPEAVDAEVVDDG